jgi:hypothetical protein
VMTTLKFRKYSGRERTRLADELDIGCKWKRWLPVKILDQVDGGHWLLRNFLLSWCFAQLGKKELIPLALAKQTKPITTRQNLKKHMKEIFFS